MAKDLFLLVRPQQWVKNLLVVAPAFFGGIVFDSFHDFMTALLAFFSFSFASSAGYIFNDLLDIESDKNHPFKRNRPVASGRISTEYAIIMAIILLVISILLAFSINSLFTLYVVIYLLLTASYTIGLKNIVIVESFCIATGFLLRIVAGGASSGLTVSIWLILTTVFLSLLLAFGKRRSELNMSGQSRNFRKVLSKYNKKTLDYLLIIFALFSVITYSVYLFKTSMGLILVTIPLASFGVIRYTYLARKKSKGDPTEALLKDRLMLSCVAFWLLIKGIAIYMQ